jgi:hypothetical protein
MSRITYNVSYNQLTVRHTGVRRASIVWVDNFGETPVDKHSALNIRFGLVVTISQVTGAYDRYVAGADVSMKNANFKSGFVSYNASRLVT